MRSLLAFAAAQTRVTDPKPWRSALFSEQQTYFDDESKRKTAVCTRRAGKTKANGALLVDAAVEQPQGIALYLTLTAKISRDSQEAELDAANARFDLGLEKSVSENRWYTPEGGCVWLAGCKDRREAEKFRGRKYSRVIIDEAGTHRKEVLEYLVNDVLSPALTDLGGQLCLTGTPGEIPTGIFHDVSTGKNPKVPQWSPHAWSVLNNPHHDFGRDPAKLEAYRLERGLDLDDPTWLREFQGLWVLDTRALIYRYEPTKHTWNGVLPSGSRTVILGVDLGYDDETAFVITIGVDGSPNIYVPEAHGQSQMLPAAIAAEIQRLRTAYGVDRIYVDSGGLGKTILNQLRLDYGLPVIAAAKQDKAGSIKRVQGSLAQGRIKIAPAARAIHEEWETLAWNDDRTNHKEGIPDHCTDAFLYAFRQHSHAVDWVFATPTVVTAEEYSRKEMDRMKADLIRRTQQKRRR